jgi:hypothetical protein
MELRINEISIPEQITFNFEELKQELTEKVSKYETLQYGEEEVKDARKDRAALNKLKTAIKEERLRREREYMKPFDDFKQKINEIVTIIDKPINMIDKQLDEYENKRRADKRVEIGSLWENMEKPEWLVLSRIFDEKWLNATVTIKSVVADIDAKIAKINSDLETLNSLEEFSFEAIDTYKRTLDLNMAIAEGKRLADIQRRKEEQRAREEQAKAEAELAKHMPAPESPKQPEKTLETLVETVSSGQWVSFKAFLTVEQAQALKAFFNERNIEFKAI